VHGSPSDDSQDYVVLLFDGRVGFECTGTLVAPRLVLTARHCVSRVTSGDSLECAKDGSAVTGGALGDDYPADDLEVYVGATRARTFPVPDARGTRIVHDGATNLCNHDLALLEIAPGITGVAPSKVRLDPGPSMQDRVTVIGWGVTDKQRISVGRTQRDGVPLLAVGPTTFQGAGVPPNDFVLGESICDGDSGSPAFVEPEGAVIGVASFGSNGTKAKANDPASGCVDDGSGVMNTFTLLAPFRGVLDRAAADTGATLVVDDEGAGGPAATDGSVHGPPDASGSGTAGCDVASHGSGYEGPLALALFVALLAARPRVRPNA
jgi:hypothetical protein